MTCKRVVAVKHTDEQMRDELYCIVDAGAKVLDVIVEHELYGQISVDLLSIVDGMWMNLWSASERAKASR